MTTKEKPLDVSPMSSEEARRHIDRLETSQTGFARAIGVQGSTVRKWIKLTDGGYGSDVPGPIAVLLRLLTPEQVRQLLEARDRMEKKRDRD